MWTGELGGSTSMSDIGAAELGDAAAMAKKERNAWFVVRGGQWFYSFDGLTAENAAISQRRPRLRRLLHDWEY